MCAKYEIKAILKKLAEATQVLQALFLAWQRSTERGLEK